MASSGGRIGLCFLSCLLTTYSYQVSPRSVSEDQLAQALAKSRRWKLDIQSERLDENMELLKYKLLYIYVKHNFAHAR